MTKEKLTPEEKEARSAEERECKTLEDWQALGVKRGYKEGWAVRRHELRLAAIERNRLWEPQQ